MPLRTSIQTAVVSGLAHLLAFLVALFFFAIGAAILIVNIHALTIQLLVFALVLFTLAMLFAIPAQTKEAVTYLTVNVVPNLPVIGGRRSGDK